MATLFGILALVLFPLVLIRAAIGDLTTMKIPNRLVLMLLLGYIILAPLSGHALQHMGQSAAAAAAVFAIAMVVYACGWMGAGDVKLMAVSALWLGVAHTPAFLLWTSVFGCLLTAGLLLFRAMPLPESWHRHDWTLRLHTNETQVPYGVAIAAAALLLFFTTSWMAHLR